MMYQNLYQCCETVCNEYQDRILFIYDGRKYSYKDVYKSITARSADLTMRGITKGDVVGLISGNGPEWCITYIAIVAIGAIVVPMDTGLQKEKYSWMLSYIGAKAVYLSKDFSDISTNVEKLDIDFLDTNDSSSFMPADVKLEDTCSYLFTSGTTGDPKIVTLTHHNIMHIAITCTELEEYTPDDVTLAILPLFHVYALEAVFLAPLVSGSSIVFQPSLKGPDIIKSLSENPITIFPAAPQMWHLFFESIVKKIKAQSMFKYRFFMFLLDYAPVLKALGMGLLLKKVFRPVHDIFGHNMRFFISGGAPMKKNYFNYYKRMGFHIMEGYGLTETTGPIAIPYYKKSIAGSVGVPIKGNFVKIKNAVDGVGEIWLKGEAVMTGYFRNDTANNAVFDDERFFNSGDLGRLDKNGAIYITGRSKNVIVLDSGKNVYPEEVESYYGKSSLIEEIAVVGRQIEGSENVFAVIVPFSKNKDSFTEIQKEITEIEKSVPSYKRIQHFALSFDPLPKNSTRKVLISEIKKQLDSGVFQTSLNNQDVLRKEIIPTTIKEEAIVDLLKNRFNRDQLFRLDTLRDYGIDSLGLIDLIVFFEESLGINIDIHIAATAQTLEEFIKYIAGIEKKIGSSIEDKIFKSEIITKMPKFFPLTHHITLLFFKFLSKLFWKVEVVNAKFFENDNCIIASNHQSYLDIVWIATSVPVSRRRYLYAIGKKRLTFLKYIFPMLPAIFIDDKNTLSSLKASSDILRAGKSLIIFPEGTRTINGSIADFKNGAAYLAKNLNKKIIPVTISGGFEIFPKNRIFPKIFSGLKGRVVIGQPVDPADFCSVDELNLEIMRVIKSNATI